MAAMYSIPAQIPLPAMPPMFPKPIIKPAPKTGGILKKSTMPVVYFAKKILSNNSNKNMFCF